MVTQPCILTRLKKSNCGGLKENGPNKPIENDTIKKYGLVGVRMSLLDKVVIGAGFEVSDAQAMPNMTVYS